MGGAR
jgi:hypothetical protein